MGAQSRAAVARAIKTARTINQTDDISEQMFGSVIADVARLLYPPPKTAAHIAALVRCSERHAEFCLSGQRKWSGDAIAAIVAEILRRHSMRNVKVSKR